MSAADTQTATSSLGAKPDPAAPSFVLSGGGALGAYQAGVLLYIVTRILPQLPPAPLGVISGTSIGAISGCFLAAAAQDPATGMQQYAEIWRRLDVGRTLPVRLGSVVRMILGRHRAIRGYSIADPAFLINLVVHQIPWLQKRRNLAAGRYASLIVTTTRIRDGRTILFYESALPQNLNWGEDPYIETEKARIGPSHIVGSSALPMLFPPARIGIDYFTDGGIRMNTPLSPAMRLGGRRIIAIELKNRSFVHTSREERTRNTFNPAYMAGKLLQAVLVDRTEHERSIIGTFNRILETGFERYGQDFVDQFTAITTSMRGAPILHNRISAIVPSADVSAMAADAVRTMLRTRALSLGQRRFLGWLASDSDSELLGLLLFDGSFAGALISLGMEDARTRHSQIVETLTEPLIAV